MIDATLKLPAKMKRGPYRQYNKDPSVPVPKASDWRHKKEMEQLIYANQEGNATRNEENIDSKQNTPTYMYYITNLHVLHVLCSTPPLQGRWWI